MPTPRPKDEFREGLLAAMKQKEWQGSAPWLACAPTIGIGLLVARMLPSAMGADLGIPNEGPFGAQ